MSRVDDLAEKVDLLRLERKLDVDSSPADELWARYADSVSGTVLKELYGVLLHYTSIDHVESINTAGIGRPGRGCWLTPSTYSACVAPYRLGLRSARDMCVMVDVSSLPEIWGPGTSRAGNSIWTGGGIEFYYPGLIPAQCIVGFSEINSCGDA